MPKDENGLPTIWGGITLRDIFAIVYAARGFQNDVPYELADSALEGRKKTHEKGEKM